MELSKKKCALCGMTFNEEDDVVFCPDCGAPHHRECWKVNGHCACEEFHGTGETPSFDAEIPEDETFEREYTDTQINEDFDGTSDSEDNINPEAVRGIIDDINNNRLENIEIAGIPADLFEAAIGKNQRYYIPRFMLLDKTENAKMWNFMAFLTPMAWAFYRKLYKVAAIFLALYLVLGAIMVVPFITSKEFAKSFAECYEEDVNFIVGIAGYSNNESGSKITEKQKNFIEVMEKLQTPEWFDILVFVGMFAIKTVFAFSSTKLYFKELIKKIKSPENSLMTRDVLKMHLYKKCGTAPLWIAVILGLFEFYYL